MARRLARPEPAIALPPALVQSIDANTLDLPNARVLVGSDAHVWPGPYTAGMRSFL
jgi:hypothetical protein